MYISIKFNRYLSRGSRFAPMRIGGRTDRRT